MIRGMSRRRLFCELGPFAFWLSRQKGIWLRHLHDAFSAARFCRRRQTESLPILVFQHESRIRRRLAGVDPVLQNNKATNLTLAAPRIDGVIIRPGETFSLWRLLGNTTRRKGYLPGLVIACGKPQAGEGGGMCQLSNLLHWMVLHSDLTITEHHHHDRFDLFPDDGRQVPFGMGTSIVYNYLDYRVTNTTSRSYQFRLWVDGDFLRGELRADDNLPCRYRIRMENERFVQGKDGVYRSGEVYRDSLRHDGKILSSELLRRNYALVMYDTSGLKIEDE